MHDPYNKALRENDTIALEEYGTKLRLLEIEMDAIDAQFVKDNPNSPYAALIYLNSIMRKSLSELEDDYAQLGEKAKNSIYGKEIAEHMKGLKLTAVGNMAPEFTAVTSNGKKLSLSDYKGKYVLLDFWGSWCGPCRDSHPHLVQVYEKYKGDGLEIVGLAGGESDRQSWLKAIEEDKLSWPQVDMGENKSTYDIVKLYGIKAFPTKVLVDYDGKILLYSIGGEGLDEKLKEVYGH